MIADACVSVKKRHSTLCPDHQVRMNEVNLCIVTTLPVTLEAFVVPAADFLAERGYRITLVCSMTRSFLERYSERFNCVNIPMARGIDPISGPLSVLKMVRLFRTERFDIVQYATPNASLYTALAAFLVSVPGRLYCQWGIRYVGFHGGQRKIFRLIERVVCALSTHINPASRKNLNFAVSERLYRAEKAAIIGHGGTIGVDLSTYKLDSKGLWRREVREKLGIGEQVVYGFVGSVRREKGVNELLGAFRSLLERGKNAALIILGSEAAADPLDPELRRWSMACPEVHFCGLVNDTHRYIAAMDILVHPSYREGFSMVIQEAGALGVPVITTDIPGPSEVIEKNVTGLLVPPRNTNLLAEAMLELANGHALRERMGRAAFERTRSLFRREVMLKETLQHRNRVYKETR
jgi:glycosyltransferase involved in cell wall biosynthesis